MANTISASLVLDKMASSVLTVLGNRLAPLRAFSTDFTTDILTQQANVQVKKATTGSAPQTNPTDFETGDTTLTNVNVLVNHVSKSFQITSKEYNQQFRLEDLFQINAQLFADNIMNRAIAPVTAANFPTNVTIAQASFSATNAKTLWGSVAKSMRRHLLLDGVGFANLLPTSGENFQLAGEGSSSYRPGAYGYDGIILNTNWTGAGANIYGFACGPEAVAVAAGIPDIPDAVAAQLYGSRLIAIEQLGLTVQLNYWGSTKTRTDWASIDVMFGSALGDNTAGAHIKSA
jgi:hypothetical protein